MNNINPSSENDAAIGEVDIKAIIAKFITYWYLFFFSIIICLSLAFVAGVLTPQMWKISGKILIDDDNNNSNSNNTQNSELTELLAPKHNSENDLQVLQSRDLISKLVQQTNLSVKVYQDLSYKSFEIFDMSPFQINIHYKTNNINKQRYKIRILNNNEYNIRNSKLNIDRNIRFGESLNLKDFNLVLTKSDKFENFGNYSISIQSPDEAIAEFLRNFQAAFPDKASSTIDLAYNYSQPRKGEYILNKLIQLYIATSLQNKLRTADSTLKFIDGRLAIVANDLGGIQQSFEKFQQQNGMVDITEKTHSVTEKDNTYSGSLVQQDIQIAVVNELLKSLSRPGNVAIPSNVGLTNGTLISVIDSYNTLVLSRDKLRLSLTDKNPVIQNLDGQMESNKAILIRSLEAYKRNLEVARNQLSKQEQLVQGNIKDVPRLQTVYTNYARQEKIKEDLYVFLLQKREEVAISKTSTITNVQIIEHAKSASSPFEPAKSILYLMGIIAGFLIPASYLGLKEFLNTRIRSKHDIEKRTNIPIVGEIGYTDTSNPIVIGKNSRSNVSEQFRALRTNLNYLIDAAKPNVILFTSSMHSEGKTFLSLNLGSSLGLTGKKVIFLELDLRKPKISTVLGIDNSSGISNFLISTETDYRKIIKQAPFNENCFLLSSGPIPPNPSELLLHPKLSLLIDELRKEFDYIIIDTAPVGLVADPLLLERFSDLTLYVVRQDYTHKPQLDNLNELKHNGKIKSPYIIFNSIKLNRGDMIYGYGYGYGYGYYQEENNKSFSLANLFKKKKA